MTPKHEFKHDVKLDVEARVREGVKSPLLSAREVGFRHFWHPVA